MVLISIVGNSMTVLTASLLYWSADVVTVCQAEVAVDLSVLGDTCDPKKMM